MFEIKKLSVQVEDTSILNDVSFAFELGKNYCILGKNWSWKSSLAMTIMWHPKYIVNNWQLIIDNWSQKLNLLEMSPSERAKAWVFLAFQSIPEIEGLKLFEFLRTIYSEKVGENVTFLKFKAIVKDIMDELHIDHEFLWRDLNVWFSGGERRKIEILQIKLLQPKYIFLDEVDSGLDVDAFRSVANLLKSVDNENNCFIIITHLFTILEYISVNKVFVMKDWKIEREGGEDLAMQIREKWFEY